MASTRQKEILAREILPAVGAHAARLTKKEIVGFLAMEGASYNREMMVVGRAVNDWGNAIDPRQLADPAISEHYAECVFSSVTSVGCPMSWVIERWQSSSGYNTRKSAFWRVIRKCVGEFGIADINGEEWPSFLVWSNLYKIAPAGGGNPGNGLCTAQLDGCLSMFRDEINTFRPKRILLLTGLDWAEPFLSAVSTQYRTFSSGFVEAAGCVDSLGRESSKIVVASHPQTRPEDAWVSAVKSAFSE